jgi:2-oxopent-4-enoate hydratase
LQDEVLQDEVATELGRTLYECFQRGEAREPLTDDHPNMTPEEAYQVQQALVRMHLAGGRKIVGRKIGLTSAELQRQVGIDQPDYGALFDTHVFENGAVLSREKERMILPRIEAELGFILDRDLIGPGLTAAQVLASTRAVFPAFEIVDSRLRDWKIKLADTIADNSSCWGIVLGDRLVSPLSVDLSTVGMVLERETDVLRTGAGAAVLGHPALGVAWLGNKLAEYGERLRAGEYVLSGSFTAVAEANPGRYRARFGDGVGTVELEITN